MEDREFFDMVEQHQGAIDKTTREMKRLGQAIDVITSRALYNAIVEMTPERRYDVSFILRISPIMVVPDSEPYPN